MQRPQDNVFRFWEYARGDLPGSPDLPQHAASLVQLAVFDIPHTVNDSLAQIVGHGY